MWGLSVVDLAVLAAYVALILWLGLRARKGVASSGDYFLGNRRGNKPQMIANAIGAGTHTNQAIHVAGATYEIGLAGVWYQWFFLFATPFFWLVAPIYRRFVPSTSDGRQLLVGRIAALIIVIGLLAASVG